MKSVIHGVAGTLGIITILTFITSTLYAELLGGINMVAQVKTLIVFPGLAVLLVCMAAVGKSGFSLSRNASARIVHKKKKRMALMAANGAIILIPCALLLNYWASSNQFGTRFYILQVVELVAGLINVTLMIQNMRDGLALSGRLSRRIITPTEA